MSLSSKRKIKDIKCLSESYNIEYEEENSNVLYVNLEGPNCSPWKGGKWKIRIELPEQYPYKSPSVGFITKIWHPNVCYNSGTICLNVLNQSWTPIYTASHIIDTFLPQLLTYPNPEDPLNQEAAKMLIDSSDNYSRYVKSTIFKENN